MATGLTVSFDGQYAEFPSEVKNALSDYVMTGHPMGHFLTSVASNNLFQAIAYADDLNIHRLKLYVQWFYNVAPSGCHGSKENVKTWQAHRGLAGLET